MQLDHINVRAPRSLLDEVREFYCAVFGLEAGFRPRFRSEGYWLYADGHALIHLSEDDMTDGGQSGGHLDHVAFRCDNREKIIARLDALDVDYRENRVPELDMIQLFFNDPAGIGVEVNFVERS